MTRGLRAGIAFLTATQIVVGLWALFFPVNFFALDVVGMGMAYNEHLMRDYGAMTLASAVVLSAATVRGGRTLTVVALSMYLMWAIPHFIIHVTMLDHLSAATGAMLLTGLGIAIALAAGLLVLAASPGTRGRQGRSSQLRRFG